jgi:hypothetical protein
MFIVTTVSHATSAPCLVAFAFSGSGVEAQPDRVVLGVPHGQADLGLLQAVAWIAIAGTQLLALCPDGVDEPIDEVAGPFGLAPRPLFRVPRGTRPLLL